MRFQSHDVRVDSPWKQKNSFKGSREGLSDKEITNMAMITVEIKKGATKHCSRGLCKPDSRYPESMPVGTHFIRFAKVTKVKDGMTEWGKMSKL